MNTSTELVKAEGHSVELSPSDNFLPVMSAAQTVERYNALVNFVRQIMREGTDYGVIPGTKKKSLLKPGAEKLCTLFGLSAQFDLMEKEQDWEYEFFHYRYKCTLSRDGKVMGNGEGSCNSKEDKYRWRKKPEKYATEEEKKAAVKRVYNDEYRSYTLYLPNTEICSQVNTLQKMAQKRALTAAVLITINASDFFTQDLEEIIDVESEPVKPTAKQHNAGFGFKASEPAPAPSEPTPTQPDPRPEQRADAGRTPDVILSFKHRPSDAVRDEIKKAGFRWNAGDATWTAPSNAVTEGIYAQMGASGDLNH